ncbi:MAG: TlyA family RNA methyltransferase, partial [Candidatus Sumerlaeota bacterium]
IGSSTGGFTDCLLQRGAKRVYAIDAGTSQLADRLREDARVVVMEKTNARRLKSDSLGEKIDGFVADVSFISLGAIIQPAASLLRPGRGWAVVLVKPQFEAEARQVGRGGIVRDTLVHRKVLGKVVAEYVPQAGLKATGLIVSPVRGTKGNREYLLRLERKGAVISEEMIAQVVGG